MVSKHIINVVARMSKLLVSEGNFVRDRKVIPTLYSISKP